MGIWCPETATGLGCRASGPPTKEPFGWNPHRECRDHGVWICHKPGRDSIMGVSCKGLSHAVVKPVQRVESPQDKPSGNTHWHSRHRLDYSHSQNSFLEEPLSNGMNLTYIIQGNVLCSKSADINHIHKNSFTVTASYVSDWLTGNYRFSQMTQKWPAQASWCLRLLCSFKKLLLLCVCVRERKRMMCDVYTY